MMKYFMLRDDIMASLYFRRTYPVLLYSSGVRRLYFFMDALAQVQSSTEFFSILSFYFTFLLLIWHLEIKLIVLKAIYKPKLRSNLNHESNFPKIRGAIAPLKRRPWFKNLDRVLVHLHPLIFENITFHPHFLYKRELEDMNFCI